MREISKEKNEVKMNNKRDIFGETIEEGGMFSDDEVFKLTLGAIVLLIGHSAVLVLTIITVSNFWGRVGVILLGLILNSALILMLVDIRRHKKINREVKCLKN